MKHAGRSFAGSLEIIPGPALLQCLEASRCSGVLSLRHGALSGSLSFKDGMIVAARARGLSGEDAAFALATLERGEFEFEVNAGVEAGAECFAVQPLLMEALWVRDELLTDAPGAGDAIVVADRAAALGCFPESGAWRNWVEVTAGEPHDVAEVAAALGIGVMRCRAMLAGAVRSGAIAVASRSEAVPERAPRAPRREMVRVRKERFRSRAGAGAGAGAGAVLAKSSAG